MNNIKTMETKIAYPKIPKEAQGKGMRCFNAWLFPRHKIYFGICYLQIPLTVNSVLALVNADIEG
jgi:hypothetical protein